MGRTRSSRWVWLCCAALGTCTPSFADWDIPANSPSNMMGGAMTLGCTDLRVAGTLTIGAGGSITEVRHVVIEPGGSIQLAGGRIELAQNWDNRGTVDLGGGQVLRVASAGCPTVGPLGPVAVDPVPVPTLGAGAAALLAALLGGLGLHARRRRAARRSAAA